MKTVWNYEYPFGGLFQHSVKLSERLAFSPFFAVERESGRCLWEAPVTLERSEMLYPRALAAGVIVAEKYEAAGSNSTFRGIYRFDAATGAALESPAGKAGLFSAGVQSWMRRQRPRFVNLTASKLQAVRNGEIVTVEGDVIDIRTGIRVRSTTKALDNTPSWSPLLQLNANADFVSIPSFGELYPGAQLGSSVTDADNRFWSNWPHSFHLRKGKDVIWTYSDEESRAAGLAGSITYDQILRPGLYFLLYKVRTDESTSKLRDAVFDLALRRLDLRTGQVVDHIEITDGPLHKWPSIADVDERGLIVMYRQVNQKTTKVTYLEHEQPFD